MPGYLLPNKYLPTWQHDFNIKEALILRGEKSLSMQTPTATHRPSPREHTLTYVLQLNRS